MDRKETGVDRLKAKAHDIKARTYDLLKLPRKKRDDSRSPSPSTTAIPSPSDLRCTSTVAPHTTEFKVPATQASAVSSPAASTYFLGHQTSTPVPSDSTQSEPGGSLWNEAFKLLSEENRKVISFTEAEVDKQHDVNIILKLLEESTKVSREKALKLKVRGKEFIVRDLADKALAWIEKFKEIGDNVVQYDPVHAALPWAGIRLLLQVFLKHSENSRVIIFGIETITRIILRCKAYEMYYMRSEPTPSNFDSLRKALVKLYAAVLEFLACTTQYLIGSGLYRVGFDLLKPEGIKPNLDMIEECDRLLATETDFASMESNLRIQTDLKDRMRSVEQVLDYLENPIIRIDETVQTMFEESKGERRAKILTWISTIAYGDHHKAFADGLLEGTGKWLLDKAEFQEWQTSSASSILWLRGIHWDGSRTACATGDAGDALAYFYCKRDEPDRRDAIKLMRSLVKQLSEQRAGALPKLIIEEHDKREQGGYGSRDLTFSECHTLLVSLLNIYRRTTLVVDALDEIDRTSRDEFLEALRNVAQASQSLVKIFVSSRNDDDIVLNLQGVPNLYINASDNTGDIEGFTRREIESLSRRRLLLRGTASPQLKERIISTLVDGAHGMFLWVDLQIKHLCGASSASELERLLGALPDGLERTYSGIYASVRDGDQRRRSQRGVKALTWVLAAQKPLTPGEWEGAVGWTLATLQGDSKPDEVEMAVLLDVCQNMVVHDREQNVIRFAHLSVREFLEKQPDMAADIAARACLAMLQHQATLPATRTTEETSLFHRSSAMPQHQTSSSAIHTTEETAPFYAYSVRYWPEHVQQCEWPTPELMSAVRCFLGSQAKPATAYAHWFDAGLHAADEIERQHHYVDYSFVRTISFLKSPSPNPLLAAAYFGFDRVCPYLWEPATLDPNCTNSDGQTPFFLACSQGHRNVVKLLLQNPAVLSHSSHRNHDPVLAAIVGDHAPIVELLLDNDALLQDAKYKDVSVMTTASVGGAAVMNLLLHREANLTITESVLAAAAANERSGKEVMELLLQQTDTNPTIAEDVVTAAAANWNCGKEVMELLLQRDPNLTITEDAIAAAANNQYCGKQVMELLLRDSNLTITESIVVSIAEHFDQTTMALLLQRDANITITESIITAAALNRYRGKQVMELLLERDANLTITKGIIIAAASNKHSGKRVMDLLLQRDVNLAITESVVISIAEHFDQTTMELLLQRDGNLTITEGIITAIAANENSSKRVMELLLQRDCNIPITESVVKIIAEHLDQTTMELLLQRDANLIITESVITAAATNWNCSKQMIELLLQRDANLAITESVLTAAALNRYSGKQAMELLLERDANLIITESVVTAAAANERGKQVMELLLERNAAITESVLIAAALNRYSGKHMMGLLLHRDANLTITESVLAAAAANERSGKEVMELLLERDANLTITEGIVTAAAANERSGKGVMELLLKREANLTITEGIVTAAIANECSGKQVMQQLLQTRRDTNLAITESVVISIAEHFDQTTMELLLLQRDANLTITEGVFTAAARNWHSGKQVMELLLQRDANPTITEGVVTAAALNRYSGKEVMELLLQRDANLKITEGVLTAAALNRYSGKQVMELLLQKDADLTITERVVAAAAANERSGKEVMELLLQRDADLTITERVVTAAAANLYCGKQVMQLLLQRGASHGEDQHGREHEAMYLPEGFAVWA